MLGLPDHVRACLFDLDGVLTPTAALHDRAWRETFDEFLAAWAAAQGTPFVPFDPDKDYETYVDGKPRADGVRDFLASRGITLPEGTGDDAGTADDASTAGPGDLARTTVHGLANRKNDRLLALIRAGGVQPYEGSRRYLEAARDAGLRRAVVSASANCAQVLRAAGLEHLVEARIDGITIKERTLRGKPAPDTFLEAARQLGVPPGDAAVFEDALAGVEAGRAGGFGCVVGVDRVGPEHADQLREHGATLVVRDLAELLP